MNVQYDLIVIQEEAVPLSASVSSTGTPYFIWALTAMLFLAAFAVVLWYVNACRKYRERYFAIIKNAENPQEFPKAGWRLGTLKLLVSETENTLAERMLI